MLEHEGTRESKDDAESHGDEEGEEEDADSVEEREDVNLLAVELRESPTSPRQFGSTEAKRSWDSLEHDDGDGVVEDGLAKDDRVQLGVDVESVEDGENCDGVRCRESRSKEEALDDREGEAFESEKRVQVDDNAGEAVVSGARESGGRGRTRVRLQK